MEDRIYVGTPPQLHVHASRRRVMGAAVPARRQPRARATKTHLSISDKEQIAPGSPLRQSPSRPVRRAGAVSCSARSDPAGDQP